MNAFHNGLRRFCAWVIGLVFLSSGILKLMDPVGTSLIIGEYLKFFHLGFLSGASKLLGVILALIEAVTGAALLTGVFRKVAAITASALIALFTVITLILLIFNPEMDCGCFGEAIHLTHLQTFLKNVILLVLGVVAFIPFRDYGKPRKKRYAGFVLITAALIAGVVYCWVYQPPVEFTAFTPGAELMASQDNDYQALDGVTPTYIYEKDGRRASFPIGKLPDSTWTFVAVDTIAWNGIRQSDEVPILSFTDSDGEYQDELAVLGKVLVLSVYDTENASQKVWDRLSDLRERVAGKGVTTILLTPRGASVPDSFTEVYNADYKTLVTLNRSNGGATWFDDGMLIRKWPWRYLPKEKELKRLQKFDPMDSMVQSVSRGRIRFHGFLLYLLAALLLL